eukprot:20309-Heterococcus_DN1.PRE.2
MKKITFHAQGTPLFVHLVTDATPAHRMCWYATFATAVNSAVHLLKAHALQLGSGSLHSEKFKFRSLVMRICVPVYLLMHATMTTIYSCALLLNHSLYVCTKQYTCMYSAAAQQQAIQCTLVYPYA